MGHDSQKFWYKLFFVFSTINYTRAAVNLALGKHARQSSTFDTLVAVNALNGNVNQHSIYCSHTGFPGYKGAWWQVDLGEKYEVKNVTIYSRDDIIKTRRLKGFQMFLNQFPNEWQSSEPCYRDVQPGYFPTIFTVNCSGNYRHVTIYNNHTIPEHEQHGVMFALCEVQVFGCPSHTYGAQCENLCSSSCVYSTCDVDDGYCLEGCKPNRFGHNCTNECHCITKGCDRKNGTCYIPGCKAGWFGVRCNTACTDYTFGLNCNTTCHCKNSGCNNVDGVCNVPGCNDGWKGTSCDKPCDWDTFGKACGKVCHCLNGTCDPVSGICFNSGCDPGWIGESCSEVAGSSGLTQSHTTGMVVGILVVILVIVAVLTVVAVLVYRHRKSRKQEKGSDASLENIGNIQNHVRPTTRKPGLPC